GGGGAVRGGGQGPRWRPPGPASPPRAPPPCAGRRAPSSTSRGSPATGSAASLPAMTRGQDDDARSRQEQEVGSRREDGLDLPPKETFNQDAETIARRMASKKVSPKGIGSGIRMIQFFINRAGKNLPVERKDELEKAKHILREKLRKQRKPGASKKGTS